jgi:hypothetical protein
MSGRLLALLQLLPFLQVLASATTAPTVDLGYAWYQGAVDIVTNTTSFLGIRYAAAPVGMRSVIVVRAFHRGLIPLAQETCDGPHLNHRTHCPAYRTLQHSLMNAIKHLWGTRLRIC